MMPAHYKSLIVIVFITLSPLVANAQIEVTNINDDNAGSLRDAIGQAISNPGPDTITFNASLSGDTISLLSSITISGANGDSTFIQGDIDENGTPDIVLFGGSYDGLIIQSDSCLINGLVLIGFTGAGNSALVIDGASGTVISGNYVGTSPNGQAVGASNFRGITLENSATGNFIGDGTAGGINVISNNSFGVYINSSDDNTISGNIIGLDLDGNTDLGNFGSGIEVINSDNTNIGVNGDQRNVISGNDQRGINLSASLNTLIVNNYIGYPGSGVSNVGNGWEGIYIDATSESTQIGDASTGGRNVISYNGQEGIQVLSNTNDILGNYIGLRPNGGSSAGNANSGIYIESGQFNDIGNGTTGGRNTISSNGQHGILVADGPTFIVGNIIGLAQNGNQDFGNGLSGILVSGGLSTQIGGPNADDGNIISGNSIGISITGSAASILRNYIGLNLAGNAARPNDNEGIRLTGNAQNVSIGDGTSENANIISGNTSHGILLSGSNVFSNTIDFNYIGLEDDFTSALGNGGNGILIENESNNNTISNNSIAHNVLNGVALDGLNTEENPISQNSIFSNTLKGISISNSAQAGIPPPVITAFGTDRVIQGNAEDGTVEIFFASADEGDQYTASTTASGGSWSLTLTPEQYPLGLDKVTTTITDANGNTSEFSNAIQSAYDLFEVVNTESEGVGSLRWCIDNANTVDGTQTISFNIPTSDDNYAINNGDETWTIAPGLALPEVISGQPVVFDATTQPGNGNFRIHLNGGDSINKGFELHGTGSEVYGFYIEGFNRGIEMGNPGNDFIIGTAGKGNTIVQNVTGIFGLSSDDCIIQGNFIGTDENGTMGIGNSGTGVSFGTSVPRQIIGGPNPGDRNIISGNARGISTNLAGNSIIEGNYIGTDPTGMIAIPNNDGIRLGQSSSTTIINNLISGNSDAAILFNTTNSCFVYGNLIGVAADTITPMPNGRGIGTEGSTNVDNNTIGGLDPGEPNWIAYNTGFAVEFFRASFDNNSIIGNYIYCNGGGIDLDGVGNEGKTAPIISTITLSEVNGTGIDTDVIHLYRDTTDCGPIQGVEYLGSDTVSSGTWSITGLTLLPTDHITATATDINGNTSEFAVDAGEIAVFTGPDNLGREIADGQNDPIYLGTSGVGSFVDTTITIENLGLYPLFISDITSSEGAISILGAPSVVSPNSTESVTLRLDGSTSGIYSGTITIESNDIDETSFDFTVIGEVSPDDFSEKPGNALDFDGTDDYVTVSHQLDLNPVDNGEYTIEAWINPTIAREMIILSKGNSIGINFGRDNFHLEVEADSTLSFATSATDATGDFFKTTQKLRFGVWQHVALVISDYGGPSTAYKFYINGEDAGLEIINDLNVSPLLNTDELVIGASPVSYIIPFVGRIDEVRIWSVARSQTQITEHLYSMLEGDEMGLTAYYRFDQGSTEANNSGINQLIDRASGYTGTLNNFSLTGESSNWISSEALAPQSADPLNATNVTDNGFRANYVLPPDATNIFIDVDNDADFSSPIVTNIATALTGSEEISMPLTAGVTYFFRTRAEYSGEFSYYKVSSGFQIKPGNGISFDGINDYIEIPDDDSLKIPSEVTISLWAKRKNVDRLDILLEKGGDWTGGSTNYGLGLHNSSLDNMFYFFFDGGWRGTQGVTDLDWHHYVVVAREGDSNVELYIDGMEQVVDLSNGAATISLDETSTDPLYLGAQITALTYYGASVMDELHIWNRALSHAEIRSLIYRTLEGDEPGLVAYYQFDEGTPDGTNTGIDVLPDRSKNRNDGSLENFDLSGTISNWTTSSATDNNHFIMTWQSYASGSSNSDQIIIPTEGTGYNYDIYWEDITNSEVFGLITNVTGDQLIDFPAPGDYRVEISGDFPRIYFNNEGDAAKIISIEQWGDQAWASFSSAFNGCQALSIPATDAPDLSGVTDMSYALAGTSVFNQSIDHWDVNSIQSMQGLFSGSGSFNQPLSSWVVDNVSDMSQIFDAASSFNQSLSNWNVEGVTNMSAMFRDANSFDQDISDWDISGVTQMTGMLDNSGLSSTHYDNLLVDWAQLSGLQNNVEIGVLGLSYCVGTGSRQELIDTYSWDFQGDMANCSSSGGVPPSDYDALVDLYNSTGGNNWTDNTNWLTGNVENWFGINVENNRVTRVRIEQNNLTGSLPASIGNLTAATEFDLESNGISGSIPVEIGEMVSLTELDLEDNLFTGTVPAALSSLEAIQNLSLEGNQLAGSIPTSLATLTNLIDLSLGDNGLTGNIPTEFGDLVNLQYLQLDNNQLTGNIPSNLGSLTSLIELSLNDNQLTGSIPVTLGDLLNLQTLDLDDNELTGGIPPELSNLTNLRKLAIGDNFLGGSIPTDLGDLVNLEYLELDDLQLTGPIITEIGNFTNLQHLDLSGNQLDGGIPLFIGDLSNLTELYLSGNELTGSIPSEIGNLTNLTELELGKNNLNGVIPESFGDLVNLIELEIDDLNLSGSVPSSLTNLTQLTILELDGNQFENVPDFSSLTSLVSLYLEDNQFEFDDLEPNTGFSDLNYTPQAKVSAPSDISVTEGDTISVSIVIGGSQNNYQWVKDGANLTGQTSSTLFITPASTSDDGEYSLTATSSLVPGLTIESESFSITVTASDTDPPIVTANANKTEICQGEEIVLTGGGALSYSWDNGVENGVAFIPESSGTYTVVGTDENNNTDTAQVSITVNALPNVAVAPLPGTICSGDVISLSGTGAESYVWDNGVEEGVVFIPTNGVYTVTGTDVNGCQGTASIEISLTEVTKPSITVTSQAGRNLTLSASAADSYQWYENDMPIEGAMEQSFDILISAPNDRSYFVEVTENGCSAFSDVFGGPVLGLDNDNIDIYPVPVKDILNVSGLTVHETGIIKVNLYDTNGKCLLKQEMKAKKNLRIDLSEIPAGIYFMEITGTTRSLILKE